MNSLKTIVIKNRTHKLALLVFVMWTIAVLTASMFLQVNLGDMVWYITWFFVVISPILFLIITSKTYNRTDIRWMKKVLLALLLLFIWEI